MKVTRLMFAKTMYAMAFTGEKMTEISELLHNLNFRAEKSISLGYEIEWLG